MKSFRMLAICAALFNFLGVIPLLGLNGVYRPRRYEEWLLSIAQEPFANSMGGALFTIGVGAFFILGVLFVLNDRFWQGICLATGAALNGLTTLFPFVIAYMLPSQQGAEVLLALALLADSMYNALLGACMMIEGVLLRKLGERGLGTAGIVIGIMTVPICLQALYERAALWLGVAGPAWIIWWLFWSFKGYNIKNQEG
ncbi:MAG: hypothetical protein CMK59_12665 [Proteobacteria bacterium]|nr:hypothetical protein [Pseudomonadota bacterium]